MESDTSDPQSEKPIQSDFDASSETTGSKKHWDLPPPPVDSFISYEVAKSTTHEWARRHGYDLSVKKTYKNRQGKIVRRVLVCTRGGKLDNKRKLTEETRVRRKRSSKKGGCQA
jgi:FAR1 DNA-binding domain